LKTIISNYNGGHIHNPTNYNFIPVSVTVDTLAVMNILNDEKVNLIASNIAIELSNKLLLKTKPNNALSGFLHLDDYNKVVTKFSQKDITHEPVGIMIQIKPQYKDQIKMIIKYFKGKWGDMAEFSD